MLKKLFLWLLSLIFGPKLVAAEQGAEAAYQAADEKEQAEAVEAKAEEMQQIETKVKRRKEKAHAQVAQATYPDAVVNQQLRDRGLVSGD